ncbi:OPT/YSL family transporter [Streptomyces sp. YS415]|uniref:OPT/YSL family transporter n=1 Tax=Streptomyces sp. YS415 TaxID=2944806 RepID=UPI00202134C9|nr:OPT/YSL family transporter [Streptomyces sp. YS415]MCL7429397.1 OPT family oligopeptide transporter [Streptomyces sp. YS415]
MPRSSVRDAAIRHAHPRAFEPVTLSLVIVLSVLGSVTGLVLITTVGVAANTAVIGAVVAMALGRTKMAGLSRLRDPQRQNLVQSAVSGSTFGAANSLLMPLAVPVALGRPELVWTLLGGAVVGLAVDSWVLYRTFDSALLPADAPWPTGIAAAETIEAGDQGGRKARILALSALVGAAGAALRLPLGSAGLAFLGNVWALGMFAVGLLIAQYVPALWDVDLAARHVPHGIMIGAGCVALAQAVRLLLRSGEGTAVPDSTAVTGPPGDCEARPVDEDRFDPRRRTVDGARLRRGLVEGGVLLILGASALALFGGLSADLGGVALVGWVLFAGVSALAHQLIVGLTAMHSGWFPAFALTVVFMMAGLLVGMPTVPLALLTGYIAATGPAFADMGFDLKSGWLLRRGVTPWQPYELAGRRQQYLAQLVGFGVAVVVVAVTWQGFLSESDVPPIARVYADTITAGLDGGAAVREMALWAVPGALLQLLGGSSRQMGILFGLGLLVGMPNAGWFILAALGVRVAWTRRGRRAGGGAVRAARQDEPAVVGAGLVAGSSLHDIARMQQSF